MNHFGRRKSDNQAYPKNKKSKLSKTGSLSARTGILIKFMHKRYPNDTVLKTKGLPVRFHIYDTGRGDYFQPKIVLGNNEPVDLSLSRRDGKGLLMKVAIDVAKSKSVEGEGDVYLLGRDIDNKISHLLSMTMATLRHNKSREFTDSQLKRDADISDRYFKDLMKVLDGYGWAERTSDNKWKYLGHGIDFKQVPKSELPQVFK